MSTKKHKPFPPRRPNGAGAKPIPANGRWMIAGALAALAAVAVLILRAGNDDGAGRESNDASGADPDGESVTDGEPGQRLDGLLLTGPPWPPQYDELEARVRDAGFPVVGDESYHVHALLSVFVDGEQVEVPTDIGIDRQRQFLSPLHTHTPDGVIHFEADDPAPFTLGQVFDVWGVAFDAERLGNRTNDGSETVHVLVHGEAVDDPRALELADGDNVVVAYGRAGTFPLEPPTNALENP